MKSEQAVMMTENATIGSWAYNSISQIVRLCLKPMQMWESIFHCHCQILDRTDTGVVTMPVMWGSSRMHFWVKISKGEKKQYFAPGLYAFSETGLGFTTTYGGTVLSNLCSISIQTPETCTWSSQAITNPKQILTPCCLTSLFEGMANGWDFKTSI